MVTLLHKDNPLDDLLLQQDNAMDESNLPVYTKGELLEFGDGSEEKPILIAIIGRVYDVSAGKRFYGEDGSCGDFAGHDVTYSLCTGCRTPECLEESVEAVKEDSYPLVGKLEEANYLEELMKQLINEELAKNKMEPRNHLCLQFKAKRPEKREISIYL